VTVAPNTTHRMNSKCSAKIAAANAEYTSRFLCRLLFLCSRLSPASALCRGNLIVCGLAHRATLVDAAALFAHSAAFPNGIPPLGVGATHRS
jgi:hypothetical protein